jgi:hypothetical protein
VAFSCRYALWTTRKVSCDVSMVRFSTTYISQTGVTSRWYDWLAWYPNHGQESSCPDRCLCLHSVPGGNCWHDCSRPSWWSQHSMLKRRGYTTQYNLPRGACSHFARRNCFALLLSSNFYECRLWHALSSDACLVFALRKVVTPHWILLRGFFWYQTRELPSPAQRRDHITCRRIYFEQS